MNSPRTESERIALHARIAHASAVIPELVEKSKTGKGFRVTVPSGTKLGRDAEGLLRIAYQAQGSDVEITIIKGVIKVVGKREDYAIPAPR